MSYDWLSAHHSPLHLGLGPGSVHLSADASIHTCFNSQIEGVHFSAIPVLTERIEWMVVM